MRDFAEKDALQPLDFAASDVETNLGESAVELGSVDGTLYGFLFKAANKSTVWYNVAAFEDAGRRAARDLGGDLLAVAETINSSGLPAYSIGGATGGRSPTCSRTSTSARPGPRSTTSSRRTRSRGPTSR